MEHGSVVLSQVARHTDPLSPTPNKDGMSSDVMQRMREMVLQLIHMDHLFEATLSIALLNTLALSVGRDDYYIWGALFFFSDGYTLHLDHSNVTVYHYQ